MGYAGKVDLKKRAQQLRKQGLSYKEIITQIPVSKDTISKWCRDIILTDKQKAKLLQNKLSGQRKGSLVAAENKRNKRIEVIEKITQDAIKDVSNITDREMFLLGIALYAAEGTKADKHGAFSNADPNLISFMTKWFITYVHVPKEKLRGRIWIHNNLDEQAAKRFWEHLTKIPLDQFIKSYVVNRKSKSMRKNIHPYGVFTVSFSDATLHRRIMGWISGLFGAKIAS